MANFMLLLVNGPGEAEALSPEEIQSIVAEYGAWAGKLGAEGKLVESGRLSDVYTDPGRRLTGADAEFSATDGPLAEAKEVIGGYFRIEAADYDEAVQIARGCPHLRFGNGRIDIREVI